MSRSQLRIWWQTKEVSFWYLANSQETTAKVQGVDVVIVRNSGMKCLEAIATLRVVRPDLRVLVTGAGSDNETILKAITSGAKGYVDEAAPTPDLVQAIFSVHQGSVWIPRVMSMFIERSGELLSRNSQSRNSNFTSREKQGAGNVG
jgi:DNA-binding NarL/FixJ family response regulator